MAWMCTKCFQEFNGHGNTCNDCIRREQLEEQNNLIRQQNEQLRQTKYRTVSSYSDVPVNHKLWLKQAKAQTAQTRNEVLGQIAGYFILYLLDKIFLNGFVFSIIWDVLVIGYEVIALFVGVLFDIFT